MSSDSQLQNSSTDLAECKRRPAKTIEDCGYLLGDTIGHGAYAKVKLARYARTGKKVAVKVITKHHSNRSFVTKFLPRELESMRVLQHKHVIKLLEILDTDEKTYIVMELASNGDLLEYINSRGHLSDSEAKRIFRQLTAAISYCHQKGCIIGELFRDLKCENILMDAELNAKITDFGFSTLVHSPTEKLSTHCGSFAYAAPEILLARSYIGSQTDIWSLAVILFAMACGRLPFCEKSIRGLIIETQQPLHWPTHKVSEGCRSILLRMLTVEAWRRATMKDIQQHEWLSVLTEDDVKHANNIVKSLRHVRDEPNVEPPPVHPHESQPHPHHVPHPASPLGASLTHGHHQPHGKDLTPHPTLVGHHFQHEHAHSAPAHSTHGHGQGPSSPLTLNRPTIADHAASGLYASTHNATTSKILPLTNLIHDSSKLKSMLAERSSVIPAHFGSLPTKLSSKLSTVPEEDETRHEHEGFHVSVFPSILDTSASRKAHRVSDV